MDEEILFPVCPHRNVPAAFQRVLGPDSGGFERFFPDERMQRFDGTLLIVRVRSQKAMTRASYVMARLHAFAHASSRMTSQLLIRAATLVVFGVRPLPVSRLALRG